MRLTLGLISPNNELYVLDVTNSPWNQLRLTILVQVLHQSVSVQDWDKTLGQKHLTMFCPSLAHNNHVMRCW